MSGVKSRWLIVAGYTLLVGCGARTSSLMEDEGGAGGISEGGSGNVSAGGAGGAVQISGGPQIAGAPQVAGAPPVAGAGGVSGGSGFAGFGAIGGSFGGFGAVGGSFAGFGAIGGDAGTGGISEVCSVLGENSCQQCICNACSTPITTCFASFGCGVIFLCTQQTGCNGLGCYQPNTCRSVIDQFGGLTGQPMQALLSLGACAGSAQSLCCN